MYLHIGSNKVISTSKLLGIFNAKNFLKSKINKKYLKNEFSNIKCKSFILCVDSNVLCSNINVSTLVKRLKNFQKDLKGMNKIG